MLIPLPKIEKWSYERANKNFSFKLTVILTAENLKKKVFLNMHIKWQPATMFWEINGKTSFNTWLTWRFCWVTFENYTMLVRNLSLFRLCLHFRKPPLSLRCYQLEISDASTNYCACSILYKWYPRICLGAYDDIVDWNMY